VAGATVIIAGIIIAAVYEDPGELGFFFPKGGRRLSSAACGAVAEGKNREFFFCILI